MHTTNLCCYGNLIVLKIKSVAYSSQGSHSSQLNFCNCLQMAVIAWQDNVINITLHQVATQLSSRGWVDPISDLIHI